MLRSNVVVYLQYIPDKLQILIRFPATWKLEVPLPPPPPLPPSSQDQTGLPSSRWPPCGEASKSAARWAEGGRATGDGKMMVRSSETAGVAEAGGWGCSEARGGCSGQRTPGGGTTQTHLQLHLKDKDKTTI